jgi:hypothetical protein
MALDLANGWQRYDNASASNIYYGYNLNPNAANGDYTWLIRRLNTSAGVQSYSWANNDSIAFCSSWTNRASYFAAPSGSMAFTYSKTNSGGLRFATFTWTLLAGVDKYTITSTNQNGQVLDASGNVMGGINPRIYTDFYVNTTNVNLAFPSIGTYSVTLSGSNVTGATSSTYTINFTS